MPTDLGKIKGNAFREFLVWYEGARGPAALAKAFHALPRPEMSELDPDRRALGVLASSWYDASVVHHLLEALTRDQSEIERRRFIDEGSRATINAMMRGVQKIAFDLLVSPNRLPKMINMLWRMTYDSGHIEVVVRGQRCHESIMTKWRGHHPLVCSINMRASVPMYEAMGCRGVTVAEEACISRGNEDCRSVVQWTRDPGQSEARAIDIP